MESYKIYILAALATIITYLFLRSSEDWPATLCSPPYLLCTVFILVAVYSLLAQSGAWTARVWQLHQQHAAKAEEQQASHRKRERALQSTIAALENDLASQAEAHQTEKDAAFYRHADLLLERNSLKRRLKQAEDDGFDTTSVRTAYGKQNPFNFVRATMAEVGISVSSPREFRQVIQNLCRGNPQVVRVMDKSLVPLSAELVGVRKELSREKAARESCQDEIAELKNKLTQAQQNQQHQPTNPETIQEDLANEKTNVKIARNQVAELEAEISELRKQRSAGMDEVQRKLDADMQDRKSLHAEIEELRAWKANAIQQYWQEHREWKHRLSNVENELASEKTKMESAQDEFIKLNQQHSTERTTSEQQSAELESIRNELTVEKNANAKLYATIFQRTAQLEELKKKLCPEKAESKIQKNNKRTLVDDKEASREGASKAQQEVQDQVRKLKADLGQKESEYKNTCDELEMVKLDYIRVKTSLDKSEKKARGLKATINDQDKELNKSLEVGGKYIEMYNALKRDTEAKAEDEAEDEDDDDDDGDEDGGEDGDEEDDQTFIHSQDIDPELRHPKNYLAKGSDDEDLYSAH